MESDKGSDRWAGLGGPRPSSLTAMSDIPAVPRPPRLAGIDSLQPSIPTIRHQSSISI